MLSLFLVFMASRPCSAQDNTRTDSLHVHLRSIRVTATPYVNGTGTRQLSFTSISRTNLQVITQPALTLESITQTIPGLQISNRENYSLGERITIRGMGWRSAFGVRNIQLILDGIPLTGADGQAITNIIDPAFVRRIQVIRGPASVYWGNGSGGVLSLSTMPPHPENTQVRIREMAGSYGLFKSDLEITQPFGNNQISAYASYLHQNGYRMHSRARLGRGGFTGRFNLTSRSYLNIAGAYIAMPEAQNPGSLTLSQFNADPRQAPARYIATGAGKSAHQGQLGLTYLDDLGTATLTVNGYGIRRLLDNPLTYTYVRLKRWAGGTRITLESNSGPLDWGIGIEEKFQRDDRKNINNNGGIAGSQLSLYQIEKVNNTGVFGRLGKTFGRFGIHAGLRLDRVRFIADDRYLQNGDQTGSRTFHAASPSVGLDYRLDKAGIYVNLSSAFETPTTTELGNTPDTTGGFNPDINPEKTVGIESGIRGQLMNGKLHYDAAVYDTRVNDLLLPYQNPLSDRVYYRNSGKTRHLGIEFSIRWVPSQNFSLTGEWSVDHSTFLNAANEQGTSLNGNLIPGIIPRRFSLQATWSPQPIQIETDWETTAGYYADELNTGFNKSYLVGNMRLAYNPISLTSGIYCTPFVAVNNLFDKSYSGSVVIDARNNAYFEPAAGRNWQAGVSVEFR